MKEKIECPICCEEKTLQKNRNLGYLCESCQSLIGTIPHGEPVFVGNFFPISSIKGYRIAKKSNRLFCLYEGNLAKIGGCDD